MKNKLILTVVLLLISFVCNAKLIKCRVSEVISGDTIYCVTSNQTKLKIRLLNIDAPELGQKYGKESQKVLSNYILNKKIKLFTQGVDRQKKILGEVYLGLININLKMVEQGYAWVYRIYTNDIIYINAEKLAREQKIGLWHDENSISPWEWKERK